MPSYTTTTTIYTCQRKRAGAVRIAEQLKAAGCRIDAIGMQAHWGLDFPTTTEVRDSIRAYAKATGAVMITEMDIDVLPRPGREFGADVARQSAALPRLDPYTEGLPDEVQAELAKRYAGFFEVFVEHRDVIKRVTFWGLDDGRSWHNGWPIKGRTAHSLLFDRSLSPKPAFHAVIDAAATSKP